MTPSLPQLTLDPLLQPKPQARDVMCELPFGRRHIYLHVGDVCSGQRHGADNRIKVDCDLVRLHQSEHVCQDRRVHREPGGVGRVRDDAEHVLQDVGVVCLVERLRCVRLAGDVLKQLEEDVKTCVGDIAHGVLERPDDRVLWRKTVLDLLYVAVS